MLRKERTPTRDFFVHSAMQGLFFSGRYRQGWRFHIPKAVKKKTIGRLDTIIRTFMMVLHGMPDEFCKCAIYIVGGYVFTTLFYKNILRTSAVSLYAFSYCSWSCCCYSVEGERRGRSNPGELLVAASYTYLGGAV